MAMKGLSEAEALAEHAKKEIDTIAREAKDRAKIAIDEAVANLQRERERIINQMRQKTLYN